MPSPSLTAAQLAPLFNGYRADSGPPKTIVVPKASQLASLQDVTVTGTLLKKQLVKLDLGTGKRTASLTSGGGAYATSPDGDVHFCLGVKQLQPHIACEVQNAKAFVAKFNQARGTKISVSGFFRCLFEHPGFRSNDDAHIFEIHPVRAVSFGSSIQSFNVDIPDQQSIHTWTSPHNLNDQDGRITVKYSKSQDTLTFTGMDGQDENYVRVSGAVSNIKLNLTGTTPASFVFNSTDIGHPLQTLCLHGTTAARQLKQLTATNISMVALRNVDISQALKNKYMISLLAIDIQPA
jgi:hypothetical protein